MDLDNTVYCLDSTTIDLCLSLFDWARSAGAWVRCGGSLTPARSGRSRILAHRQAEHDLGPRFHAA